MSEERDPEKRPETVNAEELLKHLHGIDLLVANVIPTTKYFESRFDFLQHQISELREGQKRLEETMNLRFEKADANLRDFKGSVDKRFEQMVAAIDRLSDKLDQRDERQRNFTIRMFTIAISVSFLGVLGVLLKILGAI